MPFDWYLGLLADKKKLNIYCIVPYCSIQQDGYSDLRKRDCQDRRYFLRGEKKILDKMKSLYKCDYDECLK